MRIHIQFIACLVLLSCSQDEIPERAYPRILTHPVTDITETGAVFNGELRTVPETVTLGFVYSETPDFTKSIYLSEFVRNNADSEPGRFKSLVERSMKPGVLYYVRAYAGMSVNTPGKEGYHVYGNVVEFISKGSKAPEIASIEPLTATWGDTVIIKGENFSNINSSNVVKFGKIKAHLAIAAPSIIYAVVPIDLTQESSQISVTFNLTGDVSADFFTLKPPIIDSQDVYYLESGKLMTIMGKNFNSKHTQVLVGGIESVVEFADTNKIVFRIPEVDYSNYAEVEVQVITGDGDLVAATYLQVRK